MRAAAVYALLAALALGTYSAHASEYVKNQLLLEFHDQVAAAKIQEIMDKVGIRTEDVMVIGTSRIYLVKIQNGKIVPEVMKELREFPEVKYAEPNYIMKPMGPGLSPQ